MFVTVLAISFCATLLSSMSGAGAGLITVPSWIFLGFPLPVAIACNQVNGAIWTPIAARNYLQKGKIDWVLIAGLVPCGLCGAWFGVDVVIATDSGVLQHVIGVIILLLVCLTATQRQLGVSRSTPRVGRLMTSLCALPLGFYEGFFGSGNGLFTSILLINFRGFELTTALGYYYAIAFSWNSCASALYLHRGFGDLSLIVPSSIGALAGAYVGSRVGRNRGPRFVRRLFITCGGILGLKLAFSL